ncbi:NUDIX hydrolase [Bacteroidota bacterium]
MVNKFLDELESVLKNELPGKKAQMLMAPSLRIPGISNISKKRARDCGVLILLYKYNNDINTVFILRTSKGPHSGEISLPGGKKEKDDISIQHTALRECREEIGSPGDEIRMLGRLSQLYVPFSNFIINPYIAYINYKPEFIPNPREVEDIIEVSLKDLFSKENQSSKTLRLAFFKINAPYFDVKGQHIWGATAMILSELQEILKKAPSFRKLNEQ